MASKKSQRRYWLFKSEPDVYGWDQFVRDGRTHWDGVRNYQARNFMRDDMQVGDGVLFYHSNAKPMAVVGVARIVKAGYPDHTARDKKSKYHDAGATEEDPRWYMVDIVPVQAMAAPIERAALAEEPDLAAMVLLQRGSRLSVQPVTEKEWQVVLKIGKAKESW